MLWLIRRLLRHRWTVLGLAAGLAAAWLLFWHQSRPSAPHAVILLARHIASSDGGDASLLAIAPRGDAVGLVGWRHQHQAVLFHTSGDRGTGLRLPESHAATCIAFNEDRALIGLATSEGVVRIWRAATGELVHELHSGTSFAFSADGRFLATSSKSGVTLWERPSFTMVRELKTLGQGGVTVLTFSPDSAMLAGGMWSGEVNVWRTTVSEPACVAQRHSRWPRGADSYDPVVHRFVSTNEGPCLRCLETTKPRWSTLRQAGRNK